MLLMLYPGREGEVISTALLNVISIYHTKVIIIIYYHHTSGMLQSSIKILVTYIVLIIINAIVY